MMLLRYLLMPITVPLSLIHQLITSPLTLSLVLRLILLFLLLAASGVMSVIAVGTFWWTWGRAGDVEVEGWLVYGSKQQPTPHSLILFPTSLSFPEDVKYDVEVEMELIRPKGGMAAREMDNFMLSLDFLSEKNSDVLRSVSQPCLPAQPYSSSYLPSFSLRIPSLNPLSHIPALPFLSVPPSDRLRKPSPSVAPLIRPMLSGKDGIVLRPHRGARVGGVGVKVGREDERGGKEVATTGWVVVRFKPRPTGIRWILTSHPLPPLIILPPIALTMTISSALFSYLLLTCCFSGRSAAAATATGGSRSAPGEKIKTTMRSIPPRPTTMRSIPPQPPYGNPRDPAIPTIAIAESSSPASCDDTFEGHPPSDAAPPTASEDGTLETASASRTPTSEEGHWSDVGGGESTEGE